MMVVGLVGMIQFETRNDDEPPDLALPDGFQSEVLLSPTKLDSSSWVALSLDEGNGLYAADQHGALYHIQPPPIGESLDDLKVTALDLELGHAQGLLWAFNSLYVVVNSEEGMSGRSSGLYRVTDTDHDSVLDHVYQLVSFEGWGEHGPHGIILGTDSSSLYMVAGNHTELPEMYHSKVPQTWETDQLLPTLLDPRGHAADIQPPGGWVIKTDSLASHIELISVGYRNAYDLAFNEDGELFTFDSDMEWDLGMPWYRPVRVVHVTQGSEFGWRTGSGKWPDYYPDNLPSVVEIGQGSPTGVLSATHANFPIKYRRGLLVFDWSFGTIYHVDLKARGSTYTGTVEEFLSGTPLPVTDGIIGRDGAFYFLTGGRELNSFLYRVYYDGHMPSADKIHSRQTPQRQLRHTLEGLHSPQANPDAIKLAWEHLNHSDRFIQYAARIAIEHQPLSSWQSRALNESDPVRRTHSLIALSRHVDHLLRDDVFESLLSINLTDLSSEQEIDFLRALGLVCIRLGFPDGGLRNRVIEKLQGNYPSGDERLNREYGRLLAALQAPELVEQMMGQLLSVSGQRSSQTDLISDEIAQRSEQYGETINVMRGNPPSEEEIELVMNLRVLKSGWTPDLRKDYFTWFHEAMRRSGGESYIGFLEDMRADAAEHLTEEERDLLAGLVDSHPGSSLTDLPQAVGPYRSWNLQQLQKIMDEKLEFPRDFEQGQKMYAAALCSACHRMGSVGGAIGPDLTAIGSRFSRNEILSAIDSPSDAISDQYQATILTLDDGSTLIGRVLREEDEKIFLNQNPYDLSQEIGINLSEIQLREVSPVSTMPSRLLNQLNEEEVTDLMAYLLSGGDIKHQCYSGINGCETKQQ